MSPTGRPVPARRVLLGVGPVIVVSCSVFVPTGLLPTDLPAAAFPPTTVDVDVDVDVDGDGDGAGVDAAVAASRAAFPDGGSPSAVVASAGSVVDASAAASLAGAQGVPVLLVTTDGVPPATARELQRLGVRRVVVVGGRDALPSAVEDDLSRRYAVERLAGATRAETAAVVARRVGGQRPDVVLVAATPADAAVAAPLSAARGWPLLLTDRDEVPEATAAALARVRDAQVVVVGGADVIAAGTAEELGADLRVGGSDRFATAVEVARFAATDAGFTTSGAGLAPAGSPAELLEAAPAAAVLARTGTPLLLDPGGGPGTTTREFLAATAPVVVFGPTTTGSGATAGSGARAGSRAPAGTFTPPAAPPRVLLEARNAGSTVLRWDPPVPSPDRATVLGFRVVVTAGDGRVVADEVVTDPAVDLTDVAAPGEEFRVGITATSVRGRGDAAEGFLPAALEPPPAPVAVGAHGAGDTVVVGWSAGGPRHRSGQALVAGYRVVVRSLDGSRPDVVAEVAAGAPPRVDLVVPGFADPGWEVGVRAVSAVSGDSAEVTAGRTGQAQAAGVEGSAATTAS